MTRFGRPISEVYVKDAVDPQIGFSSSFLEWEAATAAGLDLWKWENSVYPRQFKARVIAWFNMHNQVELHKQDALAKKMRRK